MDITLMTTCKHLVIGSTLDGMLHAMTLEGDVLILSGDTCLYAEFTHSGDLRMPVGLSDHMRHLFFPPSVFDAPNKINPDRLKCHGEDVLLNHGVRILYACRYLGMRGQHALICHKSGLYAVLCETIDDYSGTTDVEHGCYGLHVMINGEHDVLYVPTKHVGNSPQEQFLRYEEALAHLPKNALLARGGTTATSADGVILEGQSYRAKRECAPGVHEPISHNPLHINMKKIATCGMKAIESSWDIIVVGGGTSGACAAMMCADRGMQTLLLEMNSRLGGTATAGGVSTYWYGNRSGATNIIDHEVDKLYSRLSLPRQSCLWSTDDEFLPDLKAHALLGMCLKRGVNIRLNTICFGVRKNEGMVDGVYFWSDNTVHFARASMVIDCTGDGDVAMMAEAAHHYGTECDGMTYWASLAQYITPIEYRNNFSTMVHVGDPLDYTRFILAGRRLGENTYDHGTYVAVRESRHIHGLATVTLEDILTMRTVDDPLYVCFSNYDPKGRLTSDMVYFGLLPPNQQIAIPRGAVIPVLDDGTPIRGILVGGKAISCTHDAFPAIRMQPDLQRQGLALAALACCSVSQHVSAEEAAHVRDTILEMGGDMYEIPETHMPSITDALQKLHNNAAWEWLDASPTYCENIVQPVIAIMTTASGKVLPLLKQNFTRAESDEEKLSIARLMLWHGDESEAKTVITAIEKAFDETDGLPIRKSSIKYGQLLPDHGLMPEVVYLINALAHTKNTDIMPVMSMVLARLECSPMDWYSLRAGIYPYCECFAYVATGRRDARFVALIRRVLSLPNLILQHKDELMRERIMMLRLTLLGALHCLGDAQADEELKSAAKDERRIMSEAAKKLLAK